MFIGIAGVLRCQKPRAMVITLFLLALSLQWFDTKKILPMLRGSSVATTVNNQICNPITGSVIAIDIFPLYFQRKGDTQGYDFFVKLGGEKSLAINTAKLAHYSYNSVEKQHFFNNHPLLANHLYIIFPEALKSPVPEAIRELLKKGQCREFTMQDNQPGITCIPNSSGMVAEKSPLDEKCLKIPWI